MTTKICPFCANEIKAAAIKCQHCQSMLDQPRVPVSKPPLESDAPPSPPSRPAAGKKPKPKRHWLLTAMRLLGIAVFLFITWVYVSDDKALRAGLTVILGVAYVLLAPLAWRGGAAWRNFAKPDVFFASSQSELVNQKLLWKFMELILTAIFLVAMAAVANCWQLGERPASASPSAIAASAEPAASAAASEATSVEPPAASDAVPASDSESPAPAQEASDLPRVSGSYYAARQTLMAAGFKPIAAPGEPQKYCLDDLLDRPAADNCVADVPLPEIASCTAGGRSMCHTIWSKGGRFLVINTAGEPQPGDVDNMHWASAAEIGENGAQ